MGDHCRGGLHLFGLYDPLFFKLQHGSGLDERGQAATKSDVGVLTPFLGTCLGWQDRVAVRCGLPMRMVADEGEVECDC